MEEGKYNRDINCLKDRDKSTRLNALHRLQKLLPLEPNKYELYTLLKFPLIDLLSDQADKCKEISTLILSYFLESSIIPFDDVPFLISSFHSRIGSESTQESCEEVRISLISLTLKICQNYTDSLHDLSKLSEILSKSSKDKCPSVKLIAGDIIRFLSVHLPKIGMYSKRIIESLRPNLYHQQFKVRVNALLAIGSICKCEGSFGLLLDLYKDFKKVLLDRKSEVVDVLYGVILDIIKVLAEEFRAGVEGKLIYLVLSSEDSIENLQQVADVRNVETKLIVLTNLDEIVTLALGDLQEWTLQDNYRSKAACALLNVINLCEGSILVSVEKILNVIFRTYSYEPAEYLKKIMISLGLFCNFTLLVSLVDKYCKSFNSAQDISAAIDLLGLILERISPDLLPVDPLLNLTSCLTLSDETQILQKAHYLIFTLLSKLESSLPTSAIFESVLILDSSVISSEIQPTLELLAKYGGISIQELYAQHLELYLPGLMKSYKQWNSSSSQPYLFAKLACRAQQSSEIILEIACFHCRIECDDEIRSKMLEVIMSCGKDVRFSQIIIEQAFVFTAAWKPNSANLRLQSISMFKHFLENSLFDPQTIKYTWDKWFPVIKTCFSDENIAIRASIIPIFERILKNYTEIFEFKEVLDIYPELLKRLDDASDQIRIQLTTTFCLFFDVAKERNVRLGNFKYIVNDLFTHLDDPNENVQKAIGGILQRAASFLPDEFLDIAKEAQKKHKHPRAVGELISIAKALKNNSSLVI